MERIKEFIRRGQRQKQAGEEIGRMCWEDEEDMSTVEGLRRMITCPTATKGTEIRQSHKDVTSRWEGSLAWQESK